MIDTQTIQQIMQIPIADRFYLIEAILQSLKHELPKQTEENRDHLLGLFEDDPQLIDQISESAMQSRERDSLRGTG
ncbi:MAG: hypothetical protein AB7S75_10475 [Desulfococcaceae bacterium]